MNEISTFQLLSELRNRVIDNGSDRISREINSDHYAALSEIVEAYKGNQFPICPESFEELIDLVI